MSSKLNSMSGTPIMTVKHFSSLEICRILKASEGLPLKAIECGPLKISFFSNTPQELVEEKLKSQDSTPEVTQKEIPGEPVSDQELKDTLYEIEQENFMIQDPAAYERQLLDERVFDEVGPGEPRGRGPVPKPTAK